MIIEDYYKKLSKTQGLIAPADEETLKLFHCCSHKAETPSAVELQLASRTHRWKEFQDLQKDFFNSLANKVEEYEIDLLRLLKLPSIDLVRRDFGGGDVQVEGSFVFNEAMKVGYNRIIKEWQKDIVGTDKIIKQTGLENLYLYLFYMYQGFSLGSDKVTAQIMKDAEKYLRDQGIPDEAIQAELTRIRSALVPQLENQYFKAMLNEGGDRIRTYFGQKYMKLVKGTLNSMAKEGRGIMDVARFLHKNTEGQLWYWLRIARSEIVLALNTAFDIQSKAAGVKFEEWNAASNACPICQAFHGRLWKLSEGPQPVSDTHPHCLCIRMPKYVQPVNTPVQDRWDRPSPYEEYYTPQEIAGLPGRFQ